MHYAIDQTRPLEATVRYLVDGKGSRFTARAFATGLLSAFGHDPTISIPVLKAKRGKSQRPRAELPPPGHSGGVADRDDDINDKDRDEINRRMHDEVLESDGYSKITNQSIHR